MARIRKRPTVQVTSVEKSNRNPNNTTAADIDPSTLQPFVPNNQPRTFSPQTLQTAETRGIASEALTNSKSEQNNLRGAQDRANPAFIAEMQLEAERAQNALNQALLDALPANAQQGQVPTTSQQPAGVRSPPPAGPAGPVFQQPTQGFIPDIPLNAQNTSRDLYILQNREAGLPETGKEFLTDPLGAVIQTLTSPPESRALLKTVVDFVDFVESARSGRQPVGISSAQLALADMLTAAERDVVDAESGKITAFQAERNFDDAEAAIELLRSRSKSDGIKNARYWQTDGVEVHSEIIKAEQQLQRLRDRLTVAGQTQAIKRARLGL